MPCAPAVMHRYLQYILQSISDGLSLKLINFKLFSLALHPPLLQPLLASHFRPSPNFWDCPRSAVPMPQHCAQWVMRAGHSSRLLGGIRSPSFGIWGGPHAVLEAPKVNARSGPCGHPLCLHLSSTIPI